MYRCSGTWSNTRRGNEGFARPAPLKTARPTRATAPPCGMESSIFTIPHTLTPIGEHRKYAGQFSSSSTKRLSQPLHSRRDRENESNNSLEFSFSLRDDRTIFPWRPGQPYWSLNDELRKHNSIYCRPSLNAHWNSIFPLYPMLSHSRWSVKLNDN